ncbi:bacillithiol biosynthesis cysteine-adding enzyme BshC [Aurantibacter sp.]|uniref:bacillithiol biosynthesis cysteine-adding enzyme BshC n=1 Tax=Aurantibacter sp. TaxID=2807103 RepID=UPI0035C805AB
MKTHTLAYSDIRFFSSLIKDYLAKSEGLKPFYSNGTAIDDFKNQIEIKQHFSKANRDVLVDNLQSQYKNIEISDLTRKHIESLSKPNTFTITTGHQLNLFTGPLYFLYKIVSAINLTKELKIAYPGYNFVPVYWMASEDHDFDEINYFNFKGKKIQWNRNAKGAVGELDTKGLNQVFDLFKNQLGLNDNAKTLEKLFKNAYLEHSNLADATRFIADFLFKDYGLVVLDANTKTLKQLFIPSIKQELEEQTSFVNVTETSRALSEINSDYKIQVNPREINLFYNTENLRERIVLEDNEYKVLNTNITFSKPEILKEIEESPESFSPNVILRPLYQEQILPNLCYIGGGGELAYWFQLKQNFEAFNTPFPILLLRNSVLLQSQIQANKIEKLEISPEQLFLKQNDLVEEKVKTISKINIDFTTQKNHLEKQFKDLYKIAKQTDVSFVGAVAAQEQKQTKGLERLEKRLLKAQKRKLKSEVERIIDLQNQLFPNQSLQERQANFSEFYLEYGETLIPSLIENLNPLDLNFTVLTI